MTKLKNSNGDKNQMIKLWENSTTEIVTKLNKWSCDKTQKLKLWQNSNCDNLKTQIVTIIKEEEEEKNGLGPVDNRTSTD